MIESQAVDHLLTQVRQVVHNHEKTLRTTGNGFSFTQALNIERDEARLHTRFIGYLLNPRSDHYQGDKFLKLFFDVLDIKEPTDGFTVEKEKNIGKVDWENVDGGRIDLLISSSKKIAYAIELKIYAGEQQKQLERYRNFLNRKFYNEKSMVYYLTLMGSESYYHNGFEKYKSISFSKHILDWLERCRLASIDQPLIRETLTQYIANIKRLTKQNPDDQMSDEIIDLITKSDASFKAFVALTSSQSRLFNKFGEALVKSIEESTDLADSFDIKFIKQSIPNLNAEISFFFKGSNDLRVCLYWLDYPVVGIGMHIGSAPDTLIRSEMKSKLSELDLGKYRNNPGWVWLSEIEEFKGQPQLTYESWQKFQSPEFAEKVAGWVKQIADAYREVVGQESSIG